MATHARRKYRECVDCHTPGVVGETLSTRGLCEGCSFDRMNKSAREQSAKSGPYYDQWRESMVAMANRLVEHA